MKIELSGEMVVRSLRSYSFNRDDRPLEVQNWRWARYGDLVNTVREILVMQEGIKSHFDYLSVVDFASTELGFRGFTWIEPINATKLRVCIAESPKECLLHYSDNIFVPYPWAKGVIALANAKITKIETLNGYWYTHMSDNTNLVFWPNNSLRLFFERAMKED